MRKINSINVAGRVIFLILLFLVIIPLILIILRWIGLELGELPPFLIKLSFSVGILLTCGAAAILIYELHQDKMRNKYHQSHRNIKLKMNEIYFECQNCGNCRVREEEHECRFCGVKFSDEEYIPPYKDDN